MMRYVVFLFFLLVGESLGAQEYEEWLKKERAGRKKFSEEEKKGARELREEYDAFVVARDKEFAEFLKQRWKEYKVFSGKKRENVVPKPRVVPLAPVKHALEAVLLSVKEPKPIVLAGREDHQVLPARKSTRQGVREVEVRFVFYGNEVVLPVDEKLKLDCREVSESFFSSYWLRASATDYDTLLDRLFAYKGEFGLNDWGYYMLVKSFTDHFLRERNSGHLLCWFLLNKSGYLINLGYGEGKVTMLIPARQTIYGGSYITRGGFCYYIMDDLRQVFTYEKDFQDSGRLMDLSFGSVLNFPVGRARERVLVFDGQDVKVSYNANVIDFYKDYPSTDLDVYFSAPFSRVARESLCGSLLSGLKGRDQVDQVGKLLTFLHKSFPYQRDEEQFGREKYLFPEEVLAYPCSDCEDRAAFFNSLVELMVGLPCIGLSYPGHVASAVKMDRVDKGCFLVLDGKRYVVCDPTYFGASVGMSMPRYVKEPAIVVGVLEERVLPVGKEVSGK